MQRIHEAIGRHISDHSRICPAVLFDLTGAALWFNRAAETYFGPNLLQIGLRTMTVNLENHEIQAILRGERPTGQWCMMTATGLPNTFDCTTVPIQNKGLLIMMEHLIDDMDMLRDSLMSTNQELSLMTRELHKKNVELQKLNELKNQFLGMAAHDLRGPIGNIQILASMLLSDETWLDAEPRNELQLIEQLSAFMMTLLNDLLDVSAIEAGQFKLHYEQAEVCELMDQAILIGGRHARQKCTAIQWERPDQPLYLMLDPRKFVQAAANLISNAVKYSPKNTSVRIVHKLDEDRLRLAVWDQGAGIPIKEQKRLFESFATGSAKSQTEEKPTGLGLLIVKKIVEAHGGAVGVISEPGCGSCFWFELPVTYQHAVKTERVCT